MTSIKPMQGGSLLVGKARATWKHLGAQGARVVSGVNAASAAGSDGWPGSPNKSALLPRKMEGEEGVEVQRGPLQPPHAPPYLKGP